MSVAIARVESVENVETRQDGEREARAVLQFLASHSELIPILRLLGKPEKRRSTMTDRFHPYFKPVDPTKPDGETKLAMKFDVESAEAFAERIERKLKEFAHLVKLAANKHSAYTFPAQAIDAREQTIGWFLERFFLGSGGGYSLPAMIRGGSAVFDG